MTKIEIDGPDGKTYEVEGEGPPEAIAQSFIKQMWPNMESDTGLKALGNTARLAGTGAVQGATDTANIPSSVAPILGDMGAGLSKMGRDLDRMRGRTTTQAPTHGFGLAGPSPMGAFIKPHQMASPTDAELQDTRDQSAAIGKALDVRPFVEDTLGLPTDPEKHAKELGIPYSPTRRAIAAGTRTAASAATLGAGAPASALAGAGAGIGRAIGEEVGAPGLGEIAGGLAGPMVALGAARAIRPKPEVPPVVPTERQASERLAETLKTTYQGEKAIVTPEIEAAKATVRSTEMPTNVVRGYHDKYLASVGPVESSVIPTALMEKAFVGKVTDFREVDNALSIIKAEARRLPAGDAQRTAIEKYVSHMMDLAPYKAPGVAGGYRQYGQFKEEFKSPVLGKTFKENPDHSPRVPPSEMGEYVSRLPLEAQEALKKYPEIRKALADYDKSRKVALIDKAIADAERSAPKFSQSGYENAIRTEFRRLSKDADAMALFSPAEKNLVDRMAKGTVGLNALRLLGKTAPTGGLSQLLHGGGILAGINNPVIGLATAGAGAVSSVARLSANKLGKAMAEDVADYIRRGGPALTRSMTPSERAATRALIFGGPASAGVE